MRCALAIGFAFAMLSTPACRTSQPPKGPVAVPPPRPVPHTLPIASPLSQKLSAPNPAPSEASELSGLVVDSDGNPLADVEISIEPGGGSNSPVIAKPDGTFRLTDVLPGEYRLTASLEGFFTRGIGVTAGVGSTTPIKLQLDALPRAKPSWNSWATEVRPSGEQEPPASTFVTGHSYRVTFDLASIDYRELLEDPTLSAAPDRELRDLLAAKPSLTLLAQPFLQGGVTLAPGQSGQVQRVEVDLDKMRRPAKYLADLSAADLQALPQLSEQMKAARLDVVVHADQPGRPLVGMALWDARTRQPLDFLTFPMTIVDPASLASSAASPIERQQSGIRALLSTPNSITADAGIGIFEVEGGANVVTFIRHREDRDVTWTWRPGRSIGEFVSEDGSGQFGLVRQLEQVHCPSPSPPACREDYSQVARFFSTIVFSSPDAQGQSDAQSAKAELENLVDSRSSPPFALVATRFHDAHDAVRPIPLGLLGLSGNRLLGNVAYLTQPLPAERPVTATACIRDFATIIPPTLGLGDDCERTHFDRLLRPVAPPANPFVSSFPALERFFSDPTPVAPPQGVLLLAHHSDGFISFNPRFSPALPAEAMTRRYTPGSAAILIGCAVGGLMPLNHTLPLISTLNNHGIDAMIFSPFSVNAELGSRLAVHFAAEVEAARRSATETSLVELYQRALDDTRGDPAVKTFRGELAEFSISGSGNLKLCRGPSADERGSQVAAVGRRAAKPRTAKRKAATLRGGRPRAPRSKSHLRGNRRPVSSGAVQAARPRPMAASRCCPCRHERSMAGILGGADPVNTNGGGIKAGVGLAPLAAGQGRSGCGCVG